MKPFNIEDYKAGSNACTKDGQNVTILDLDYNGSILYIQNIDPEENKGRTKQVWVWNPEEKDVYEALYMETKIMYAPVFKNYDGIEYATYLFDTEREALEHVHLEHAHLDTNNIFIGIAKVELL